MDGEPFSGDAFAFLCKGVGHIPEDRKARGYVSQMSIMDNLILSYQNDNQFSGKVLLKLSQIHTFAKNVIRKYEIKATDERTLCGTLSGGNQQKVIIGRVFQQSPKIIIAAQPTRGVDVGSQEFIHVLHFNLLILNHLTDDTALSSLSTKELCPMMSSISAVYCRFEL